MENPIALFGEAEKGEYRMPYYCKTLPQLEEYLGNPPGDSRGLYYAVQALLFHHPLIFFRVREEGYSAQDYLLGLRLLQNQKVVPCLSAICVPGVGDSSLIQAFIPLCLLYHSILIMSEADFYDYLTELSA
jgi:hypothetical protein